MLIDRDERIIDLLEHVDPLIDFRHRYPDALFGGQQQCVTIAHALVIGSKLVVLDKPASALDVSVQAKVTSLLDEL